LLVFDLWIEEGEAVEVVTAELLDRVWPAWRQCVAE
jgi:hypothetical protein